MTDVLARVRGEMQERLRYIEGELQGVEGLIVEKAKLEQALSSPPFAVDASSTTPRTTPRPKRAAHRVAKRAPKGANKAAVHLAIRNMPGASSGEIAKASGIDRTQVYNLLKKGLDSGELVAVDLGTGARGYRLNEQPETAFPPTPVEPATDPRETALALAKDLGVVVEQEPAAAPKPPARRRARKKAAEPASEPSTPADDN